MASGGFQADVNMSLKIGDVFSCYEDRTACSGKSEAQVEVVLLKLTADSHEASHGHSG